MKTKIISLLILAAAAFSASSCIEERYPVLREADDEVSLTALVDAPTKSPVTGTALPHERTVILSAWKNGTYDAQEWFRAIPFAWDGAAWTASPAKRWPHQGTLDFLAWSADGLAVTAAYDDNPASAVTLTVPDNLAAQSDILVGARAARAAQDGPFALTMKHAEALVTFSGSAAETYDATTNVGISITGIRLQSACMGGTLAVTRSGDNVNLAWTSLLDGNPVAVPGAGPHTLTTTPQTLGEGIVLPPQAASWFTIQYTVHGGRDAEGGAVDCPLEYTFHTDGTWDAGWRYHYDLYVADGGIAVRATLEEWRMAGNYFYGTGDHIDLVGTNFDFSEITEWWWRPEEDDAYQKMDYASGTWDEEVTFTQGGYAITVSKNGSALDLSYIDVALNTPVTLEILTAGVFSSTIDGLEYSLDDGPWTAYTEPLDVTPGMRIRLRHDGILNGGAIDCDGNYTLGGNLMSLLSREGFADLTDAPADAFPGLFRNQAHLVSASGLLLPSGNLGARSLRALFLRCVTMVSCPELNALSAASYACDSMYFYCKRLRKAPSALPATLTGGYALRAMFYNCTSLTTPPELPATSVPTYGYYAMFYNCTSLTTPPELPATTIGTYSYGYMFYGCSALKSAPELPTLSLPTAAYYYMFQNCTSLTAAPDLPATTLGSNSYQSMFYGCSKLASVPPRIPAAGGSSSMPNSCCYQMFRGCKALTQAPELPATSVGESAYGYMFYGCTALLDGPALPAAAPGISAYQSMFSGCTSLKSAKMMATDVSAYQCLTNWLYNVAEDGVLTKAAGVSLPSGSSGIPSTWTVVEE